MQPYNLMCNTCKEIIKDTPQAIEAHSVFCLTAYFIAVS